MASSPRPDPAEMSFDSLITPPHHTIDSFSKSNLVHGGLGPIAGSGGASPKNPAPLPPLMSPPVSPYIQLASPDHHHVSSNQLVQDPVLFPAEEALSPAIHAQDPLFSQGTPKAAASKSAKSASSRKQRAAATGPFVTLAIRIMPAYMQDRRLWRQRELGWLTEGTRERRLEQRKREEVVHKASIASANRAKRRASLKASRPVATTNPRPIPSIAPKPSPSGRPVRIRRATATAAAAAAAASLAGLAKIGNGTAPLTMVAREPEPVRKRTVAPKTENKDVKNFAALPDYCPPLESLQGQAKCLKVDWKSNPIDLTNDIHKHLLHPDEMTLASHLRLDCAHYLAVKRRFFVDRLKCLKDGKQFRKTDAQKACGIDVNKASQLWTAYDRVGWLKAQWMDPFL